MEEDKENVFSPAATPLKLKIHLTTRNNLKAHKPEQTYRLVFLSVDFLCDALLSTLRSSCGPVTELTPWQSSSLRVSRQQKS